MQEQILVTNQANVDAPIHLDNLNTRDIIRSTASTVLSTLACPLIKMKKK